MTRTALSSSLLAPTLFAAACLGGCERADPGIVLNGPAMGTTWNLRVVPGEAAVEPGAVRALVESTLAEIDASMSTYRVDSAISRFNASRSTDWIEVPDSLAAVVTEALRIGSLTDGALDVTISPVVALWGFGTGSPRDEPPSEEEISAALARCGARHLSARLEPPALRKAVPTLALDVDAIAPGFAADLVAERLEARGLGDYMIEIGGEVRVRGRNAQGQPWRIGIERPEERGRSVGRVLRLEAMAVSTSGDYRDYFESGGQRYSHTLDPTTGRPVRHELASVTVLRPTAAEADAVATALTVLGPEAGYALAESRGWAALFVERGRDGYRQRETTAFARAAKAGESPE